MSDRTLRRLAALVLVVFAINTVGCFKRVAIKPDEVDKLNNAYSTAVGTTTTTQGGTATVVESSVIRVERPSGRLYEVHGPADIVLTTPSEELLFEHPVEATVDDDTLKMKSKNFAEQSFQFDEVQSVELRQLDMVKTVFLTSGISLLVTGATIGITLAATPSI